MQNTLTPRVTPAHRPAYRRPGLAGLAAGIVLALAAAGCANTPLKSDKLNLAREAVVHATNMGGNDYAAAEMQAARERLDFAQTALTAGDLAHANALSDEALVNTRLAENKVQTAKAEKAATELRRDQRTLQIEIQNNLK
ncbi:MAG: DUF4398 domain-containing protein [Rhodoferax sp.]|nr:DUF4398 domain-containing protein [Rhodoferax sp.]